MRRCVFLIGFVWLGCGPADRPGPFARARLDDAPWAESQRPTLEPEATLSSSVREALQRPQVMPVAPPPISGGTLTALRDGVTVVASDPDRDRLWFTRLDTRDTTWINLSEGDEPGRVVEDDAGNVHVALRRGGAVLSVGADHRTVLARRAVCVAPRGLAWDGERAELIVACAGGEVVSIPREGAPRVAQTGVDDLRDALVWRGRRFVTTFRAAQILEVDLGGRVRSTGAPARSNARGNDFDPGVAWRTIVHPSGIVMLHQTASLASAQNFMAASVPTGGWGGPPTGCQGGTLMSAVTLFDGTRQLAPTVQIVGASLAVDLAPYQNDVVVATPGDAAAGRQVVRVALPGAITQVLTCAVASVAQPVSLDVQATSVATIGDRIVAFLRDPAALTVSDGDDPVLRLPAARPVTDTGHLLFHTATRTALACASCHPEGGDDGRVWNFLPDGPRRTQTLRGAISQTAPFHWNGDRRDLDHVMDLTFTRGMGGDVLNSRQKFAFANWLDRLPMLRTHEPAASDAVERGRVIFEGAAGCGDCHSGPVLTNNATLNIGSGGDFQVPSLLGAVSRAPYLHDGRAATLDAVLDADGPAVHAVAARLTPDARRDLLAFLRSR
jgi:hypothetical protein